MPSAKNKITFAPIAPVSGRAGDTVEIVVSAKIAKHWHSYGLTPAVGPDGLGPEATVVTVSPKSVLKMIGKPRFTKGAHTAFDKTWETNVEELSGSIELRIPVRLSPALQKGPQKASVNFLMQLCDTSACLPSEDMPQDVSITVTDVAASTALPLEDTTESAPAGGQKKASETVVAPMDTQQEIEVEKSKGLLSFFLYAMGIGFLALLTPCVFPMIPITVSFFTKRHEKTKGSGLRDSVLFGVGIISTFTAVGIIASILFGGTAVQDLAANPWLNLGIGLLFMALAFNLFGSFEI